MKKFVGMILGVTLVLSASAQAAPTIVNTGTANVVYNGQLVTTLNTDTSNDAQLYLEKASYQLTGPLTLTSGGTLPTGTWVSSYILSFDLNSTPNLRATADITFDRTVLGLIYDTAIPNDNLLDTDGTLGLGTGYYDTEDRKLEISDGAVPGSADTVPSFSGNTVSVSLYGKVNPDDVRIVTAPIPVPGAMLLAGLGTALVGWIRSRRTLS